MRDDAACGNRYSAEMKRAAVSAYKSGLSTNIVASSLGVSRSSVMGWLRAARVKFRPHHVPRSKLPPVRRILELHARFKSWRTVAELCGVSYGTVYRAAKQGGR